MKQDLGDDDREVGAGAGLPSAQLLLASLLALALEDHRTSKDRTDKTPSELLLADLGMTIGQIARVTGRNYETVKSTIRRSRARTDNDKSKQGKE